MGNETYTDYITGTEIDPVKASQNVQNDRMLSLGHIAYPGDDVDPDILQKIIQSITAKSGYGHLKSAVTATYFGHNHRGVGNPVPVNVDNHGFTFFTRPRLNLSYDNIIVDRTFTLMNVLPGQQSSKSVPGAVRAVLDPIGSRGLSRVKTVKDTSLKNVWGVKPYQSPLVDPFNPFISILDNNLISISGWPDPFVDTFTTNEGMAKEQFSMADGFSKIYNVFSVTANFRNMIGDPISYLFHIWTQYMAMVHEGVMDPWPDSIVENEIDYNTRIYRLIMDPQRRFVQAIGACGAAFPTGNSLGAKFDFNESHPRNENLDQISIPFQCMGMIYYDPILIKEFNRLMVMYNNGMADAYRPTLYHKLTVQEKPLFNYMGYPRIDPDTMELEWWVTNEMYNQVMAIVNLTGPIPYTTTGITPKGVDPYTGKSNR